MSDHLLENVLVFARVLRAGGLAVAANAAMDAVRALDVVGLERREDTQAALRAVLIHRQEDVAAFDRLFARFWREWPSGGRGRLPPPMQVPGRAVTKVQWNATAGAPSEWAEGVDRDEERTVPVHTYSAAELWRLKDFATYDADDLARARAAILRMTWTPGVRLTRRWTAGRGTAIDMRRLVRLNLRHGGEPLELPHRIRRVTPRPLVVLCDVSGSMEPYTRMLLLFLHALAARHRSIELFLFSTRLSRVTRQFVGRPLDAALAQVRDTARDWSGGTRIGDALHRFSVNWARRVLRGGPVVLLISDGWDLGEPALLRAETARLQRGSYRLVWLNPLVGSAGYEPLARGMQAALPLVDDFLSIRNMVSLEMLAGHLGRLRARRSRRRSTMQELSDAWT